MRKAPERSGAFSYEPYAVADFVEQQRTSDGSETFTDWELRIILSLIHILTLPTNREV